jgi:hypothetical protein
MKIVFENIGHSSRRSFGRRLALCVLIIGVLAVPPVAAADKLNWDELYKNQGIMGLSFTDKVQSLQGDTVVIKGFMAPPLKAMGDFFVLTRDPVALCPFCQSDADWPADIIVVYLNDSVIFTPNNRSIEVQGILQVGSWTDANTGFVSRLRLVGATFR